MANVNISLAFSIRVIRRRLEIRLESRLVTCCAGCRNIPSKKRVILQPVVCLSRLCLLLKIGGPTDSSSRPLICSYQNVTTVYLLSVANQIIIMLTPPSNRLHTSIRIVLSAWLIFSGCQPPDEATQRQEQLKREAFKLRMGMGLTPEDAEGHFQLGKIYHNMGENDKAIEAFRTAVSLDDENAQTHNHLGLVYLSLRLNDLAVKAFREAIRVEPDNPTFYNNLGYAYDIEDEFEEALKAYHGAIEIDAEFQDAYYNLAAAYHARGKLEVAIENYQRAISLDESDADAHVSLGEAFQDSGQLDQAIRTYEQALSLDSTDPEVYYQLSQLYKEEGSAGMTQLYLDLFLEKAADLPQFEVKIENAKRLKRELATTQ